MGDHRSSRSRGRSAVLLCAVLLLAGGAAGCGDDRGGEPGAARRSPASEAEWAWLQRTKAALDEQRAQSARNPADPRLARQAQALSEELDRRLVEFLNADPPVQGQPLSSRQKAALRLKSDEDIELARAFIERGGDYQRALDIYRQALVVDPGNPRLQQELARARSRRYVAREAFAQVRKGMDPDAVRRLLGAPNPNNVRAYAGKGDPGVVGWFYPRDASGAAAAVWFHKEDGRSTVYLADFDAVQPPPAPSGAPGAKGAT
jgi:tetratricopeptide (TPR) repeat protein